MSIKTSAGNQWKRGCRPPGKALIAALVGTALWLASTLAFAWPPAWQPGDKAYEIVGRSTFGVEGSTVDVEAREYDDGVRVILVNGRPFAVDLDPENICAPYWQDAGMLRDGHETPPANWRDPDWQKAPSSNPLCREA